MSDSLELFNMQRYYDQMELKDVTAHDWTSNNTIAFGYLLENGFTDWGDEWTCYTMSEATLEKVRPRINRKIQDEYYFWDIGVELPGRVSHYLVREINKVMDSLGPLYEEISGGFDLNTRGTTTTKERDVDSKYPQAQLQAEEKDYASSATEKATELTIGRGQLDIFEEFGNFEEPDAKVLKAVRKCFSNLAGRSN
jgi:hypothetical protein